MFGRLGNRATDEPGAGPAPADERADWSWPPMSPVTGTDSDATMPIAVVGGSATRSRPHRRVRWKVVAGLIALTLVAGSLGGWVTQLVMRPATDGTGDVVASLQFAPSRMDVATVVTAMSPAVVAVHALSDTERSAGTGVVLTTSGQIATNAHVVDGARSVTITPAGTTTDRTARVIDVDNAADIAVLQVADTTGLRVAPLATAGQTRVGEDVIAIGNALNLSGGPSVTRGIVSGVNRTMVSSGEPLTGMLQTDASISAGDSGGPLVNAAGQVIGIDTAVATASDGNIVQNVNFAIPVTRLVAVLHSFGVYPSGG